ncbi:MAG: hypothetical protein K8R99_15390 [Actinomycetia bacterium]|nr:hypothetical protein [Actinomycetes bacterium]
MRVRWNWSALFAGVLVLVGASACSDSTSKETCLRSGNALVCGSLSEGLRAAGLKPGSTVTITMPDGSSMPIPVGADGHLVGSNGFAGIAPGTGPMKVSIEATANDGIDFSGEILIPT